MIAAHDEDEWIASSARETEHAHFTNRLSFFLSLVQTVGFSMNLKKTSTFGTTATYEYFEPIR